MVPFRVGSAMFISLSADDVIYQDSGAFVGGPLPLQPAPSTGNGAIEPGTSLYIHGYSGGAQTRWLEETLAEAAKDESIDWIIVQMHQDALSSAKNGNGSDKGIRETWLPLFDRYGVDLVLCGHDHDYERSWPVRGLQPQRRPRRAVGRTGGHLPAEAGHHRGTCRRQVRHQPRHHSFILGGGGTSSPLDVYGVDSSTGRPQAKVITKANRPIPGEAPGTFTKRGADAVEEAIWSARRDTVTGYGVAVFDLDPGPPHGKTSITIRYLPRPRRRPGAHLVLRIVRDPGGRQGTDAMGDAAAGIIAARSAHSCPSAFVEDVAGDAREPDEPAWFRGR